MILKNTMDISLNDHQIEQLCTMMKNSELSSLLSENVILNIYNFVKFLLIKNQINSSKQVILTQNQLFFVVLNKIFENEKNQISGETN